MRKDAPKNESLWAKPPQGEECCGITPPFAEERKKAFPLSSDEEELRRLEGVS